MLEVGIWCCMEQTALVKKLSALGLDEKEAEAYVTLLELGPSPVSALAHKTGLNRSSLYVVIDRLQKHGLVGIAADKGIRRYAAVPPERLERAAKERLEKAVLTRQAIETLLPEIRSLAKQERHRPRMLVLQGREGLRRAFEESLNNSERVMRVFSHASKIGKSLPDYLPTYVRERFKRGIAMYGIHPADEGGMEYVRHVPRGIDELIYLPEDKFKFPSDFAIFGNKIAFMSHEQQAAVAIESKGIADVMKTLYDLARKEAERIGFDPHAKQHG